MGISTEGYITDHSGLLTKKEIDFLNYRFLKLEQKTDIDCRIVIYENSIQELGFESNNLIVLKNFSLFNDDEMVVVIGLKDKKGRIILNQYLSDYMTVEEKISVELQFIEEPLKVSDLKTS
ncbi:MAG: hypothetical protein AAFX87_30095, partial [Bacteroidota bacterium]